MSAAGPRPRVLLVGVLVGAVLGLGANAVLGADPALLWVIQNVTGPIGQIFLRLLFMLVVPLLFSALVAGVLELDVAHLGRIGAKTLAYTVVVSAIAVAIGLFLVNVLQPGVGVSETVMELARTAKAPEGAKPPAEGAMAMIIAMVPDNPLAAAAKGDLIGLMVFSLIFGVALAATRTEPAGRLRELILGLYDVSMTLIGFVLRLAPVGVAALIFGVTARLGLEILGHLAYYTFVVVLGLALHMFVVYSASVRWLGGLDPVQFFRRVRLAMVTAFSTASSAATLPTAIAVADSELKLPRHVSRFVLTVGSAMNQNGTALFEGVTVIFLAQVFDVPLTVGEQATIMGICILAGVGTAGVPSGSLPVIALMLTMFEIPVEGIGLIMGVNQLLDMCRTTINVTGDLAAAVVVARGEPHLADDAPGDQAAAQA